MWIAFASSLVLRPRSSRTNSGIESVGETGNLRG